MTTTIGVVVIGRNEGDRLRRCLASLKDHADSTIYVDSGSTDDSLETARSADVIMHELDMSRPFTAARARNAGFDQLMADASPSYVQFVDGDCEIQPGWLDTASAFLDANPEVVAVCGRLRERHPNATLWNRLIDMEWDAPIGEAKACGGNAMIRAGALAEIGGYDPRLIAGEEPELCVRLRQAGWRIVQLDAEMALHDVAMTKLSQWWRRARRTGYAYAQGAAIHGAAPERHKVPEMRRAMVWGLGIPVLALTGALLVSPWALLLLALWPAQILRLILKGQKPVQALFLTLGKLAEALGVLEYWGKRLTGRERSLIEYK